MDVEITAHQYLDRKIELNMRVSGGYTRDRILIPAPNLKDYELLEDILDDIKYFFREVKCEIESSRETVTKV